MAWSDLCFKKYNCINVKKKIEERRPGTKMGQCYNWYAKWTTF